MLFNLSQKNSEFSNTKAKYRKNLSKNLAGAIIANNIYPLKLMDQSREMWAVMNLLLN